MAQTKNKIGEQKDEHKVYDSAEEQALDKAGMWIGSTKNRLIQMPIYDVDSEKFIYDELIFNPAIAKLIEEVIINSADEYTRTKDDPNKRGWILDKIDVTIDKSGHVVINDNGGISTNVHSKGGRIVEIIFGKLFSSSNYDKSDKRQTSGTNGVGASLTNLFSQKFHVETADSINKIEVTWSENKTKQTKPKLTKLKKGEHYTKIEFDLDLQHFNLSEVPDGVISYIERLCILLAGAYSGLTVSFNGRKYKFKKFEDYVKLYYKEELISESNKVWECHLSPTYGTDARKFGIINGAECSNGTHMEHAKNLIYDLIKTHLAKQKPKIENLTKQQITSSYNLFVKMSVDNVEYDSQTKTKLESEICQEDSKGKKIYPTLSKDVEKQILESGIVTYLIELSKSKDDALNSKEIKGKIKAVNDADPRRLEKLTDAMGCNKKSMKEKCELWIFEGDSAGSGFKPSRNPQTQGCILLRGKSLNSAELTLKTMLENKEILAIFIALGLNPKDLNDLSGLRYHNIFICTDMDYDGYSIISQLLTFFVYHVPKLVEMGHVYRVITPLYKTVYNKEVKYHTSVGEFDKYMVGKKSGSVKVNYFKGVGSLPKSDYAEVLKNPTVERFKFTDKCIELMDNYMKKDDINSEKRKQLLRN